MRCSFPARTRRGYALEPKPERCPGAPCSTTFCPRTDRYATCLPDNCQRQHPQCRRWTIHWIHRARTNSWAIPSSMHLPPTQAKRSRPCSCSPRGTLQGAFARVLQRGVEHHWRREVLARLRDVSVVVGHGSLGCFAASVVGGSTRVPPPLRR